MIASIIKERIVKFAECQDIYSLEQKTSKKELYACKDLPFVMKMIMDNCQSQQKTLRLIKKGLLMA